MAKTSAGRMRLPPPSIDAGNPRLRIEDVAVDRFRAQDDRAGRNRLRAGYADLQDRAGTELGNRLDGREGGLDRADATNNGRRALGIDERGLELGRGDDEDHGATVSTCTPRSLCG